ncbi:MAG TPA: DUF2225 domain-containing protein, partial [Syntrophomonadaceae bacterium]|nr:DUF2225 domain-containing protein [Syntrophomonadaceae bacterium]
LGTALFKLKENIEFDLCSERNINAALYSFKLAVRSAQLKKVAEGELAGLLLATAWIAREAAEKELESYYLEEALHSYLKAYEEGLGTIGNLDDLQAAYLIGELNLRTGNYREAVNWFNQVIIHKNLKTHPAEEKMAREQWALARELGRQNYNPVSDDSKVVEDQALLIQTQPEALHTTEPPIIKRTCMQMSVNFYSDQIDWLARIVNNGYNHSKKLITKEQVVRSIIDALIELMGDTMPDHFSTEAELKQNIINMLDR